MRVLVAWILALGLVASTAAARAGRDGDNSTSTAAQPAATKDAAATAKPGDTAAPAAKSDAPAKPEPAAMEVELQQLRDLLEAQSKQLQEQNQQLKEQQKKMQVLEEQLNGAAAKPAETTAPATSNSNSAVSAPASTIITRGVSNTASSNSSASASQEKPDEPSSLHFKGITLTPGGFFAAETAWRSQALSADVNTPFNSLPVPGASNANITEFNASGRQSRISMLAEGKLANVKIGGYYETDFLSAGVTSNDNQSNSYTMRQRQFWAQAAFASGWTFTGGQMWSLVTETKNGVANRTEATPMTIDAQYSVGFSWARQYGFRISKQFGDNFWLAMSVENPETTLGAHGQNANFVIGGAGASGGLFNSTANYTFNAVPDFIFKAVAENSVGHFELFGVVSTFRDRVFPCAAGISPTSPCSIDGSTAPSAVGAFMDDRVGGGVGANARLHLFDKHMDLGIHALVGDGVGRYGTSGLPDVTVRPDGTMALVKSYQALGTWELHYPKFDFYANLGGEYAGRTAYINGAGAGVGYGSSLFNNSGCWTEPVPGSGGFAAGSVGSCTADTRSIIEGTVGFWYRFYKGPKGTIQWGPQYSYIVRNTWWGVGSVDHPDGQPQPTDNMFFTSFRYYIP